MNVELIKAELSDAESIHEMQIRAFAGLYGKYHDTETSPATEPLEKIVMRMEQPFTNYYFIVADGVRAGAIRIVNKGNGVPKRVSPIFVLPEFRNKGIASKAMRLGEEIYGENNWDLDTILEEESLCRLYERLGYQKTGKTEKINERMTIVFYHKA